MSSIFDFDRSPRHSVFSHHLGGFFHKIKGHGLYQVRIAFHYVPVGDVTFELLSERLIDQPPFEPFKAASLHERAPSVKRGVAMASAA